MNLNAERDALVMRAEAVIEAYAARWVRVDCTPQEESALRELNDLLNQIIPGRRGSS